MEILSTGEKIKRARIYQGVTLKELCGNKVSISKMSCIENEKVKADKDVLEYVAEKLNLDYDYLVRDVEDQIKENLNLIENNLIKEEELDEAINNNLNYAILYSYNELAFELIHKLFTFYVERNKVENVQLIISQYYELYEKNNTIKNTITYYADMAKFFYSIKEFNEAINYYSRVRGLIKSQSNFDKERYCYIAYKEGKSYNNLKKYENAYEIISEAIIYIDNIENKNIISDIYDIFANLSIKLRKSDSERYIKLTYEHKKDNLKQLAIFKSTSGESYFYIDDKERAIKEINEGIEIFPKDNKEEYVDFLNNAIDILYKNKEYEFAYEITDKALDLAIDTNNIKLIEKAYYLKGMILQKKGLYIQAEMYMNLSLDSLFKFASKEKRYERYLDMAELYYKLGEVKDSIKYFNLAMRLEKEK